MTYAKVYDELCRLCSLGTGVGDAAYTKEEKAWIDALSRQEKGEPVKSCSCKNRYVDAAIELRHILKSRKTLKPKKCYDLRRGEIIWFEGRPYSTLNLTDEIAEAYIALHPDAKKRFLIVKTKNKGGKK